MEERTKHGWKGLLSNIDSRKKEKARLKQATKNNRNNRNLDDFLRAGGKLGGSGAFSSLFPHSGSVQQATAPLPPRKKPRREGLAVGFHEPPDIIGEGGDDCSVPVSELKTAQSEWEQQQIPPDEHTESDGPPQLPPNRASQFGFDTSWLPPLTTDSSFLQVLSSSDKRLSMREGNETSGLARRLITSMRAEEESVLKQSIQERLQAEESNDKPSDPTLNFGFDEETESSSSASSSLSSPPLPSESEFIPDSSNHRFAPAPPLEPMPEEESPSDWEPSAIPDRPVLQSSHLPDQTPEAPTPGSKSLPSAASQTPIEEPQLRHSTASSFRPFQDFEFGVAVSTDDNASKSIAPDTPGLVHMPTSAPPTRETVRNTSPVRRYHSARKSQQQKYLHSHSQSHSLPFHSVPPPQTPQSPAASPSASMGGLSAANSSSLSLTSPASRKLWPNAIKNATENAAADFLAIADSYDALFEHMFHDGNPEPKLTDCMRASAWWVIKGRGQLESALRARAQAGSSSVSSTTISAELQQGAVNISKARWLNNSMANVLHGRGEEMTEQRNGQRRPDVSHAMIKSLRPLHQTIKSLVQALAMSMNRNNIKLVPVSEADTSPGGIDATIWLKYPDDYDLGRDLTASLSSYVPRSLRVDQASKTSDVDLAELIPMSDSPRFFNYGRMFVTAVVRHEEGDEREQHQFIPCVLSITRDRTDWHVLAFIASQSSLVNIVIQFDPKQGLTWNEVTWDSRQFIASIDLRSPFGFKLDLHFGAAPGTPPDANSQGKADYTKFRDTVDYMFKTNEEVSPLEDETVVLETVLKNFQYVQKTGSRNMTTFPIEPSQRCRIRLFERRTLVKGSNRSKHKHLGFRMVLVTSPKVKTLSCLTYFFSHSSPIVYEYMHPPTPRSVGLNGFSSPPQQPDTVESRILVLHLSHQQTSTPFQARFAFNEQSELDNFRALLNSVKLSPGELESQKFKMHAYAVEEPNSSHAKHYNNNNSSSPHLTFSGPTKAVAASVHHSSPDSPELSVSVITKQSRIGHNETINSDSLRLHVRCPSGSITDRMNMKPGDLRVSLDSHNQTVFSIYRRGQSDLTVCLNAKLASEEDRESVARFLSIAPVTATARTFHFLSLTALHTFQYLVTGFAVLFDGRAHNFAISRRRMVVPLSKKWDAQGTRLQILRQDKVTQLAAYFPSDFSHARCINFVVKETDIIEISMKNGKYVAKIVDAKFALPNKQSTKSASTSNIHSYDAVEEGISPSFTPSSPQHHHSSSSMGPPQGQSIRETAFVCFDLPDYPSEHADISITFDDEPMWREFQRHMPAMIRESTKHTSLRS